MPNELYDRVSHRVVRSHVWAGLLLLCICGRFLHPLYADLPVPDMQH